MTTYRDRLIAGHHDADPDKREKAAAKEAAAQKTASTKAAKKK